MEIAVDPVQKTFLARHKIVFCFVSAFVLTVVVNTPFLTYPLFWDEMSGLHNQAVFLKNNSFNIPLLFGDGQTFGEGGSGIYHFDFIPYLYGFFYMVLPPVCVHVIARLFSLASAFACAFLVYRLCEKENIPAKISAFGIASFFAIPYFYGQSLAAGQDMILAFFIMLSLYFFYVKSDGAAAAILFVACTIKLTAVSLGLSFCAYLLAEGAFLCFRTGAVPWRALKKIVLYLAVLALAFFPYTFVSTHIRSSVSNDFIYTLNETAKHLYLFFGWQALFVLVCACAVALSYWKNRAPLHGWNPRAAVFILFTAAFFCGYFLQNSMARCPRYAVITVMPVAFTCLYFMRGLNIRVPVMLFCIFLMVNILNSNALLLPDIPRTSLADGSYYERSLEYRKMIRAHVDTVEFLRNNMKNIQIVSGWHFPQMLTVPEFGYVSEPFNNVYTGAIFPKYAGAGHLSGIDLKKPLACLADVPVLPSFLPSPDYDALKYLYVLGNMDDVCVVAFTYPRLAEDIAAAVELEASAEKH